MVKIRKKFCLTFDIEEFDIAEGISEEEKNKVSVEGAERILKLLKEQGVRSTFFVTSNFAQKNKNLVKEINKEHEIGSHGEAHSCDYSKMLENEAYEAIKKSKEIIEGITKKQVNGFRAPRMRKVNPKIIGRIGFRYDSSYQPALIPQRYLDFFGKRKIHYKDGVTIIPTSVTPWLFGKIPLMWYGFRNYGRIYAKTITRLSSINVGYLNVYFHSWEFVDISKYTLIKNINKDKGIKKNTGEKFEKMLREYIRWCKQKYDFKTMSDMLTYNG